MTKEMYAANVKNWLMDLATGAKAAHRKVQFDNVDHSWEKYMVTASCFDDFKDGVAIHNLKKLAEAIGEPVYFEAFKPNDYLFNHYAGYTYIKMFGVRFYDFEYREEEIHEGK